MKKVLLPILTMAILFVGCSKAVESQDELQPATRASMPQAIEFSTATLEFSSMEELQNTITEVSTMSDNQKDQFLADKGEFVSMAEASNMIVEQMREIGTKEGILDMRNAYTDLFIFDPNTTEVRVAPFFKSNNHGYELVCNAYGDVKVAGSVVNLNEINTFAETWIGKAELAALSLDGIQPMQETNLVLISNSRNQKLVVTANCNLKALEVRELYLKFESMSGYNGIWYPNVDTYTVSNVSGLTDNRVITKFNSKFLYGTLDYPGKSFTNTTTGYNFTNIEFVGDARPFYSTGYNISSKWTGKNGNIVMFNNPELPGATSL